MLRYEAHSQAPAERAWPLLARPERWSTWAPHLRGAWGLGQPEIHVGAVGAARLLGVVPVPASVVRKQPGCSWTWRVGPVELTHLVEPSDPGCIVAVELVAPPAVELLLRVTYGPLVAVLVRNLARVAEREAGGFPEGG